MSKETDKLAAEMQNLKPTKTSRKGGMEAAMAAFDMEFAQEAVQETVTEAVQVTAENAQENTTDGKVSTPAQGLTASARPTGQNTHDWRVMAAGRDMMTRFSNVMNSFKFTPRAAMMGGSCMAALLVSMVFFEAGQFGTAPVSTDAKQAIEVVEPLPLEPVPSVVINDVLEEKKTSSSETTVKVEGVVPPVAKKDPSEIKKDDFETVAESVFTERPVTPSPVISTEIAPPATPPKTADVKIDTPSNIVVIERRVVKTPARTMERVRPATPTTITRRVVKTPAIVTERVIPEVTKEVTRRVETDGKFETVTETVVVTPQSVEYVSVPATYETVTETVVVQEASTELVSVPATYETIRETIEMAADGSTRVTKSVTLPSTEASLAESGITSVGDALSKVRSDSEPETSSREMAFRSPPVTSAPIAAPAVPAPAPAPVVSAARPTSSDEVLDEVVVTGGRRSRRASSGRDADTLASAPSVTYSEPVIAEDKAAEGFPRVVERAIPAVTKTVSRRVIKTPASTSERVIPAITKDVTFRIEAEDGTFKDVTETIVIQPARVEYITPPATYETVMETIVVEEARTELVIVNADGSVVSRTVSVIPLKPPKPKPKPVPQSGRLTAGDYDDVLNPDLYKVYLDKMLQGQLKNKDLPYVDADQRISIRVVDSLGKAVPMADISIKSASRQKMFPLRTGADGMAYLYPNFDSLKSSVRLSVSVKGGKSVRTRLTRGMIENGGEIVVDLETNRQPVENLDLLLTIDSTGSMGDEMRYLQSELKSILSRVEEANPGINIRTGLIVYRDKGDDYVIREIPFTDDIESFGESLWAQNANGGGDMPEAMHTAMRAGLKMDWRKDAVKVNLLVADAPPHDKHIAKTWEAGLLSRTKGIHVVPLAASGVDKTAEFLMRSMAQITGGRYLFLTDDSGIGNSHAKPTVDCYVVTRLDGLVTRVLSSLIKGERVEPEANDVIRSVGDYRSGICDIDMKQVNMLPKATSVKDEQ